MADPEVTREGLDFVLYDYSPTFNYVGKANELIEAGVLPYDTMFRLLVAGQKADHIQGNTHEFLNYALIRDMVLHSRYPEQMRPETQELLWGELPDAVVDINSRVNNQSYSELEVVYYRLADLARAVKQRRLASGLSLAEEPYDRRLHTRTQEEWARCRGIARPIWRLIVQRFHPEWLQHPSDYFCRTFISFNTVYEIGEPRMRRGIVSHALISDPLVMSIYQEAITTGVRGIGRMGKEDLRVLLSDEHPELTEGHETRASE